MSAPLVVNTTDGTVWLRRAATRGGLALYAPADVCRCPEFVMATEAELAEHGIAGSADVLPMPVGPQPLAEPVEVVAQAVAAAERSVAELQREHAESARLRAALREATDQVAALEAELGGATAEASALKARLHEAASARTWRLENGKKFVYVEDIAPALLGVERKASAAAEDVSPQVSKLRALLAGQREVLDGEHYAATHHTYLTGRDLPELGGA